MEVRATLSKIKAVLIDEIKAMVKIPESMQKVLDAYLTVLGLRTPKERKQTMKDFKDRNFDLLNAAKTVKPSSLSYDDCVKIQELVDGLEEEKIEKVSLVCKDLLKWTTGMAQLRIAEARYPDTLKESSLIRKEEKKTPSKRPITAVVKKVDIYEVVEEKKVIEIYYD